MKAEWEKLHLERSKNYGRGCWSKTHGLSCKDDHHVREIHVPEKVNRGW
jgi:hypothetical protein